MMTKTTQKPPATLLAGFLLAFLANSAFAEPVLLQWSGSRSTVENPIEGQTDIQLVWEDEKSSVGFLFNETCKANAVYTASFRIGQYGDPRYSAKPIRISIRTRENFENTQQIPSSYEASDWKTVAELTLNEMPCYRGVPGEYGVYQLVFNTSDDASLVGRQQILLHIEELEGRTQGFIGTPSLSSTVCPNSPPNVVLFFVDDLGWADLGCYGSEFHESPNCDRLASEGMRFTDAYAAGPVCSPTRVSLLTGKNPVRLKATEYFGGPSPSQWRRAHKTQLIPPRVSEFLPLSEVTVAEALQSGGYQTLFAGKWHCGEEPYWPQYQGFQLNRGGWTQGGP